MWKTPKFLLFILVLGVFLFCGSFFPLESEEISIDTSVVEDDLKLEFDDWKDFVDSVTYNDVVLYEYRGDVFLLEDYEYIRTPNSVYDTNTNSERFYGYQFIYDENRQPRIPEFGTTTRDAWIEQLAIHDRFTPLFLGTPAYAALMSTSTFAGDGDCNSGWNTWATSRSAGSGSSCSPSGTTALARVWESGGNVYINRGFLPFDTDFTGCASTGTLYVYMSAKEDEGTAYSYVQAVGPTTQASVTTLSTSDYSKCSDYDNPALVSTTIDLGESAGWKALTITDTDVIASSGVTYLGLRIGNDIEDVSPGSSGHSKFEFRTTEYAGTTYDPYLELEYADCGIGGSATSTLQATSTWTTLLANHIASEDLTIITHTEIAADGSITRHIYHIPFLWWLIIAIMGIWIGNEILWQIRQRFK